jgi:hypothetical protein
MIEGTSHRLTLALRNRRVGDRRDTADHRRAGRQRRSRDQQLIALGRSGTALHTSTRKSIAVEVRPRETVRQCLQKRNDLILLLIREA